MAEAMVLPRLACLIHAASVRSEPGSNPSVEEYIFWLNPKKYNAQGHTAPGRMHLSGAHFEVICVARKAPRHVVACACDPNPSRTACAAPLGMYACRLPNFQRATASRLPDRTALRFDETRRRLFSEVRRLLFYRPAPQCQRETSRSPPNATPATAKPSDASLLGSGRTPPSSTSSSRIYSIRGRRTPGR